jgi:dihydropteroate synthase
MAIVNCTPDSFSDGGRFAAPEAAVEHAERQLDEGADVIDVGGESTRPDAPPISASEECRRVLSVIEELRRRRPDAPISVDTSKAEVALEALHAGADLVNDVSAASDHGMLEVVAEHGAGIALMHMRGNPRTMQRDTHYEDLMGEVESFLRERARAAITAGVPSDRVWLDPGVGFGKDVNGNLALLAGLPGLAELGHPLLVGPSRKSFIGRITGAEVGQRLAGSLAALIPTVGLERVVVRVHEAAPSRQFLEIACRLQEASA